MFQGSFKLILVSIDFTQLEVNTHPHFIQEAKGSEKKTNFWVICQSNVAIDSYRYMYSKCSLPVYLLQSRGCGQEWLEEMMSEIGLEKRQ